MLGEAGGGVYHDKGELGRQQTDDVGHLIGRDLLTLRRRPRSTQYEQAGTTGGEEDFCSRDVEAPGDPGGVVHRLLRIEVQRIGHVAELEVQVDDQHLPGMGGRQGDAEVGSRRRLADTSLG